MKDNMKAFGVSLLLFFVGFSVCWMIADRCFRGESFPIEQVTIVAAVEGNPLARGYTVVEFDDGTRRKVLDVWGKAGDEIKVRKSNQREWCTIE